MKSFAIICFVLLSTCAIAQTPCENGFAGNYPCSGIDLQSHVSAVNLGAEEHEGNWVNDIWGWTDPQTGKEYALVGMTNGTSFVDVSNPVNPVVLGVLPEHNSIQSNTRVLHDGAKSVWRDIKVYADHAYIVSEDRNHGLQVFDLTNLRSVENPPVTFAESGHYEGIGKAHNLVINESTGYAFAVGFNQRDRTCAEGGLHIIDLSDPKNPSYAGCFDTDGYTHDAQCVIYEGPDADYFGKEICFNSNEDEVVIVNVSDKSNISMISKVSYAGAQYVHQGWLTEDHRYFLSNDELDEALNKTNTRTFIWDVSNLDEPKLIGFHEHETPSIDHNLYVCDQKVYQSNYTSGLRVFGSQQLKGGKLVPLAHFDTFVSSDAVQFLGSWSNYPFLGSGNILVSDITNGLFILKEQKASIAIQPQDQLHCVGDHIDIPIVVQGLPSAFKWQIKESNSEAFLDLIDMERYHSMNTDSLHGHMVQLDQSGNQYRCIVYLDEQDSIISEPMTLTVVDTASADFTFEIANEMGGVIFTNLTSGATSYHWDLGNGLISTRQNPGTTYPSGGLYEVKLIAENECSTDTISKPVDLIIIQSQPEDAEVGVGENVMFVVDAEGHELSYQWQINLNGTYADLSESDQYVGVSTSSLKLPNATNLLNDTEYRCQIMSGLGTEKLSSVVSLAVGVLAVAENPTELYPTVVDDHVNIQMQGNLHEEAWIKNLNGQILLRTKLTEGTTRINTGQLPGGMYFVFSDKDLLLGKFIVR